MSLPLSRSIVQAKQMPLVIGIAGVEQEISLMVRYVNFPELEILSVLTPVKGFNKHIDIINEETMQYIREDLA
jgi:hypothetical protein